MSRRSWSFTVGIAILVVFLIYQILFQPAVFAEYLLVFAKGGSIVNPEMAILHFAWVFLFLVRRTNVCRLKRAEG
jgi:hypothetical protein